MTFGVAFIQDVFCKEAANQSENVFIVHFEAVLEIFHTMGAPDIVINVQIDHGLIGAPITGDITAFMDSL